MKYFIDEDKHWDVEGYWRQLSSLEDRLSKHAFDFFSKNSFHDAIIISFNVLNMACVFKKRQHDPTVIEARIINYNDDYQYMIKWSGVVKFEFSFDGRKKAYIGCDGKEHYQEKDLSGLEGWAYDELTVLDDKYLSHEIELHSGAKILLHFKNIDYKRLKKKTI